MNKISPAPEPAFAPNTAPAAAGRGGLAARLQGWAMIAVLVLGLVEGLAALGSVKGRQRLADNATMAAFLSGHLAGAVNAVMAHDLPSDAALRAAGGVFRWRLFGAGGPQVSPGCANWLFLTEELRPWPDAQAAMIQRADALARIAAGLEARKIGLVLALVPDKARIEAAALCGAPRSGQARDRYAAFLGLLRARALPVVDLNAVFAAASDPAGLYYRTDTHWSQRGAALASSSIAVSVKAGVLTADHVYHTDAAAPAKRAGDLLRLMSLEQLPDFSLLPLRPRPDVEGPETTRLVSGPADGGGLLDAAPALQVVLLGSSYSLNGNFLGRLQQALGTPIGQFAQAGGAFSGAARRYFGSVAWRETPPRLVVWEIPERVVGQPASVEEKTFLEGEGLCPSTPLRACP